VGTGVNAAAETGQWIAIATSNSCGPQLVGMWRHVERHLRLTQKIKTSPIQEALLNEKIVKVLTWSWGILPPICRGGTGGIEVDCFRLEPVEEAAKRP